MNGRFRELDGLRGVASLAVVASHFTGAYNSRYPSDPPAFIDVWWGAFGVQLFFLISGFVILMSAARAKRPSDFVVSRASRLYPTYWIALAAAVVVGFSARVPGVPLEPLTIAANVTMVQRWFQVDNVNDAFWTLAVEMQFYVLLLLLLWLTRCRLTDRIMAYAGTAWLAVSVMVALIAFPFSHGENPQLVATPVKILLNATLAAYGPLFVAGMAGYLTRQKGRLHPLLVPAVAASIITTGLIQTWTDALWVAGMSLVFLVVVLRSTTSFLLWSPVQWLGKVSYSLYVIHSLLGYAVIRWSMPVVGRNGAMIVALVVVLVAAWALHWLGEEKGSRRFRALLDSMRRRDAISDVS